MATNPYAGLLGSGDLFSALAAQNAYGGVMPFPREKTNPLYQAPYGLLGYGGAGGRGGQGGGGLLGGNNQQNPSAAQTMMGAMNSPLGMSMLNRLMSGGGGGSGMPSVGTMAGNGFTYGGSTPMMDLNGFTYGGATPMMDFGSGALEGGAGYAGLLGGSAASGYAMDSAGTSLADMFASGMLAM